MIDIFPIRTKNDYRKALRLLEHSEVGTREGEDRIEILAQLVELWEQKHCAPLLHPLQATCYVNSCLVNALLKASYQLFWEHHKQT